MAYRAWRRRVREWFTRDWLEAWVSVFGVVVLAVGLFSAFVAVYLAVTFGDDRFFAQAGPAFRKGLSAMGILLFGILGTLSLMAAWSLLVRRSASWIRARRRR